MCPLITRKYFESIDHARSWPADFIDWYNNCLWHSGMQYITPMQKRKGQHYQIFEARNRNLFNAKEKFPSRWSKRATFDIETH